MSKDDESQESLRAQARRDWLQKKAESAMPEGTHPVPEKVTPRNLLEMRDATLELCNRTIEAYRLVTQKRSLSLKEAMIVERIGRIVDDAVRDLRWVEKNKDLGDADVLKMLEDICKTNPENLARLEGVVTRVREALEGN